MPSRIREVRREILPLLKNSAAVTALVPASRIYPQGAPSEPQWPFIKLGAPTAIPLRGGVTNGSRVICAVHAFAGPIKDGTQTIEYAEDHAARIGEAIEAALDKQNVDRAGPGRIHLLLSDMQLLQDGDPAAFHYFATVNAKVIAP